MHYCPTYDLSCPYCTKLGKCRLENPVEECDDYYAVMGDEEIKQEVAEILASPPIGMKQIKIKNPNYEGE